MEECYLLVFRIILLAKVKEVTILNTSNGKMPIGEKSRIFTSRLRACFFALFNLLAQAFFKRLVVAYVGFVHLGWVARIVLLDLRHGKVEIFQMLFDGQ